MRISAIIPAYNSAQFIQDALASVTRQTRPIDEIIVIDDGSTDDTAEIISSLDKEITFVRQNNQGPSAARNRGIAMASGDWIAFLDADDQWVPNKTEEQLAVLEQHPELCLIASDMAEINTNGDVITESVLAKHHLLEGFQRLDGKPVPSALAALMDKNFIPTGTVLVRRESLRSFGLFNSKIRYGEDLELWAKIASQQPITCLPNVHMLRRQHGSNATASTLPMLKDLAEVTRSVRAAAEEKLKDQGRDADKMVADSLWELGYWHFSHDELVHATRAFTESLREKPTIRALIYRIACSLPPGFIKGLRQTKRRLD